MKTKELTLGIVAHVDAGKTTLSEAMLHTTGAIRTLGRVDRGDTTLDTDEIEKERGITIYSREARLLLDGMTISFIDTPGHVDFSAEMERSLSVLDVAILVISGLDGVQSHTRTLWALLERYHIPVIVFVNKMDIARKSEEELFASVRSELSDRMIHWSDTKSREEEIAMTDEALLDAYLGTGTMDEDSVKKAFAKRAFFPVLFGSALKEEGVTDLLALMKQLAWEITYPKAFGAKVFKISRDKAGNRLVHLKVTGGSLKNRDSIGEDKVSEIRLYNGDKYESVTEIEAGQVAEVMGLDHVRVGDALGEQEPMALGTLEAVLSYRVIPPSDVSIYTLLEKIRILEEEDPKLMVEWLEETKEIHVRLMGAVQTQVLQENMKRRFGILVTFDAGKIMYKETIANAVEGIGHFEPLRHYAEVHVLMEPGERGSGITVDTDCKTEVLALNWQRLILTHLTEKIHRGVLTGSPLTDVHFTVVTGRAHLKHTVGGDFRQATYRAVRQGLKKADNVLLEPYYKVTLEVPQELLGRAMTDLSHMHGQMDPPEIVDGRGVLTGKVPVACVSDYAREVAAYTGGEGSISFEMAGYYPCHNTEEVIEEKGYDSETDLKNPTASVFCAHGAGYALPWFMVDGEAHVPSPLLGTGRIDEEYQQERILEAAREKEAEEEAFRQRTYGGGAMDKTSSKKSSYQGYSGMSPELEEIFIREFGQIRSPIEYSQPVVRDYDRQEEIQKAREEYFDTHKNAAEKRKNKAKRKRYILVDGYNVIHAWPELKDLTAHSFDAARGRLLDILSNYQGYDGAQMIVVFDAYMVKGGTGSVQNYHNVHVIFTKEAQTADAYIERACHELAGDAEVRVVTSDGAEQVIVAGSGGIRISSQEFLKQVEQMNTRGLSEFRDRNRG
jgi:small GTP-binding protein